MTREERVAITAQAVASYRDGKRSQMMISR